MAFWIQLYSLLGVQVNFSFFILTDYRWMHTAVSGHLSKLVTPSLMISVGLETLQWFILVLLQCDCRTKYGSEKSYKVGGCTVFSVDYIQTQCRLYRSTNHICSRLEFLGIVRLYTLPTRNKFWNITLKIHWQCWMTVSFMLLCKLSTISTKSA